MKKYRKCPALRCSNIAVFPARIKLYTSASHFLSIQFPLFYGFPHYPVYPVSLFTVPTFFLTVSRILPLGVLFHFPAFTTSRLISFSRIFNFPFLSVLDGLERMVERGDRGRVHGLDCQAVCFMLLSCWALWLISLSRSDELSVCGKL